MLFVKNFKSSLSNCYQINNL